MKKDKKTLLIIPLMIVLLILFAYILQAVEMNAPAAANADSNTRITNIWQALWYLAVTLTTVGYGDYVPKTIPGRAIGALFLLASIGLLSWVLGTAISLISGSFIPSRHLRRLKEKRWYLFSEDNPRSRLLAERLAEEDSDAAIILCKSDRDVGGRFLKKGRHSILFVQMDHEECLLLRPGSPDKVFLFLLGEDGWDNYLKAKKAVAAGYRIYCRSNACQNELSKGITLFSDTGAVGRLFWMEHPLEPEEKEVIIIGGRQYGEPLLERGILNNVYAPGKKITYHMFGDFEHFRNLHSRLKISMEIDGEGARGDALWFHKEPWEQNADLLERADRIILCADSDDEELELYWSLMTYYPIRGKVFVRLSHMVEEPGMIIFGSDEELYQPENVMKNTLFYLGYWVNEFYRNGNEKKKWEAIPEFHRQSSIASADHLAVKASILLKKTIRGRLTQEESRRAFEVYQKTTGQNRDLYRSIEHERWNRFYAMYNWRYNEKRDDDMRRHNCLRPYDLLNPEDKKKDDGPWDLLGQYGKY